MDLHEFAHRMPKAELHVHLEGSICPATLLQLAQRNGVQLPAETEEELREFYRFRGFPHFVQVFVAVTSCLHKPEDYTLIAYEFGRDCARQNVRYAEVTFTVATNVRMTGLPWQIVLEALNAGRTQARAEFGVEWRWVFDWQGASRASWHSVWAAVKPTSPPSSLYGLLLVRGKQA
jgi:adenosine deaminase